MFPQKILLTANKLDLIDVVHGSGPTYTYHHNTLPHSSYIDHIAAFSQSSLTFRNCLVHEPSCTNMSDHLPLSCRIEFTSSPSDHKASHTINETTDHSSGIPITAWKDPQFIYLYNLEVSRYFHRDTILNTNNIDTSLSWLHEILLLCASKAFKIRHANKQTIPFSKPWWTEELSQSKKYLKLSL